MRKRWVFPMSDWIQQLENYANGEPVLTTSHTEGDDLMIVNAQTGEITYESADDWDR